ncbi:MAG: class II aldolase/adducin family protein [Anaerolineae bacterium]|nr:class II aldolase/adducin family protein [Anaerolineae bacterium]
MAVSERQLRRDLCEVGRRLYQSGMAVGSDGNLSALLNEEEILITPSRVCKGFMDPDDIIKIDRKGTKLSGILPPSLETAMHLAAYEERDDICAAVHAHPPVSVAFTVAGVAMPRCVLPEVEVLFGGEIPVAAYATPGGPALADSIRLHIREKDVVILAHHGMFAVGQDIYQAFMKMEHAESTAKVILYARQLGGVNKLSEASLEGLRALRQKLVATERAVFCSSCRACEPGGAHAIVERAGAPVPSPAMPTVGAPMPEPSPDDRLEALVREIAQQIISGRG